MDDSDYDIVVMANGKLGWSHDMIVKMNQDLKEDAGFVRVDAEDLRADGCYERIRFYFSKREQAEAFVLITKEILPRTPISKRPR